MNKTMIPAYRGKDINRHICNIYMMSDGGSPMENKKQGWGMGSARVGRDRLAS